MPARNIHHAIVVRALSADGWTITHDPYPLSFGGKDLFVDLGAEEATLAAEKEGRRIAVEIQSFLGRSPVRSLEEAVGQYDFTASCWPRRSRVAGCTWPSPAVRTEECSRTSLGSSWYRA